MEYPSDTVSLWPGPVPFERWQRYKVSKIKIALLSALRMDLEVVSEQGKGPTCLSGWALCPELLHGWEENHSITLGLQVT